MKYLMLGQEFPSSFLNQNHHGSTDTSSSRRLDQFSSVLTLVKNKKIFPCTLTLYSIIMSTLLRSKVLVPLKQSPLLWVTSFVEL